MVCPSFQMNIAAGRNVKSQKTTLYKIFHYIYFCTYRQMHFISQKRVTHKLLRIAKIRRKLCVLDVPLWKIFYVSVLYFRSTAKIVTSDETYYVNLFQLVGNKVKSPSL